MYLKTTYRIKPNLLNMANIMYFHLSFHLNLPWVLITSPVLLYSHRIPWPSLAWILCSHKSMPLYMLLLVPYAPRESLQFVANPVLEGEQSSRDSMRQNEPSSSVLPQLGILQLSVTVFLFCLYISLFPPLDCELNAGEPQSHGDP